ncbi:hypothetical protein T439DRAFT_369200 [Meredithblackwellia eburnea MCA 4105]
MKVIGLASAVQFLFSAVVTAERATVWHPVEQVLHRSSTSRFSLSNSKHSCELRLQIANLEIGSTRSKLDPGETKFASCFRSHHNSKTSTRMFFQAQQSQKPPCYETIISHTTFLPPPSYQAHVLDVVVVETNTTLEPRRDDQRDEKTWLKNGSNRLVKQLGAVVQFFMPTPTTLAIGIKIYLTVMMFYIMFSFCSLITIDLEESHSFCLKAPLPSSFLASLSWLARTASSPASQGFRLFKLVSQNEVFISMILFPPALLLSFGLMWILVVFTSNQAVIFLVLVFTLGWEGWWWELEKMCWNDFISDVRCDRWLWAEGHAKELMETYVRGDVAFALLLVGLAQFL